MLAERRNTGWSERGNNVYSGCDTGVVHAMVTDFGHSLRYVSASEATTTSSSAVPFSSKQYALIE